MSSDEGAGQAVDLKAQLRKIRSLFPELEAAAAEREAAAAAAPSTPPKAAAPKKTKKEAEPALFEGGLNLEVIGRHAHKAVMREERAREAQGTPQVWYMINLRELPPARLDQMRSWAPDELTSAQRRTARVEGYEFMRCSVSLTKWRWYLVRTWGENIMQFAMELAPQTGCKPLQFGHPGYIKAQR